MSNEVTNADLLGILVTIKGDVGGLQASTDLQLRALTLHNTRIALLEESSAKNKGAAKVWALVGSGIGAALGGAVAIITAWIGKH